MATDSLDIFGKRYTGVTGIKATDINGNTLTYIRPQGTISITQNGTADVTNYANVNVNVQSAAPSLQTKTATYTPSETQQTATITADTGYDGLDEVDITVNAISPTYIGSGITTYNDTFALDDIGFKYQGDFTDEFYVDGYVPSGTVLYVGKANNNVSINIDNNGLITATSTLTGPTLDANKELLWAKNNSVTTNTSQLTLRTSADLTSSGATITAPAGYYSAQATKAVSSGSATAPASISGTSASVSTGTNTITLSKTVSVTPSVTAGYISSGTAGNSSVSLTASVTTKAAATITPGTSNQTIASGTYLTGTQTIAGDANLVSSNIISGKSIFGVAGNVSFVTYYTGSSTPSSSLGSDGDIYLKVSS